eukprot:SAG22_NODE_184_length_15968_cov_39.081858_1_plen_195_part_00
MRLFRDRLVTDKERQWCDQNIDEIFLRNYSMLDGSTTFERPVLFSTWMTKQYREVDQEQLRELVRARLKTFADEELDVKLVVRQRSSLLKAGSDHCLSLCFPAFPCGSTALTSDTRCNQVFNSVLEHVLRIDRIIKQPSGHMMLAGASGAGKTILSRFVSWMNNVTVFTLKVHRNYGVEEFDEDLRGIMQRTGE